LKNFCQTCQHKNIPWFLKQKFNKAVNMTFIECPLRDENVAGCLIKNLNIDWDKFINYLVEHDSIIKEEIDVLIKLGWKLKDG
jgi:hypothetical protein